MFRSLILGSLFLGGVSSLAATPAGRRDPSACDFWIQLFGMKFERARLRASGSEGSDSRVALLTEEIEEREALLPRAQVGDRTDALIRFALAPAFRSSDSLAELLTGKEVSVKQRRSVREEAKVAFVEGVTPMGPSTILHVRLDREVSNGGGTFALAHEGDAVLSLSRSAIIGVPDFTDRIHAWHTASSKLSVDELVRDLDGKPVVVTSADTIEVPNVIFRAESEDSNGTTAVRAYFDRPIQILKFADMSVSIEGRDYFFLLAP